MAISGSPKMLAYDVAKGLVSFTGATLRKYTHDDLNVIMNALAVVQREIRADLVPPDDTLLIRDKNQKLQRLAQAVVMINAHMRQRRPHT
jgi:hypothetical protein